MSKASMTPGKARLHGFSLVSAALILLVCSGATMSPEMELQILRKALGNALGKKTNAGTKRLVTLRRNVEEGRNTLVIGVVANDSPMPAGLRHGAFTDVVKILGVLKSWDWPSKIDRVMIGEYRVVSIGTDEVAQPFLKLVVSAETIRRIDWKTFEPGKIPKIADAIEIADEVKMEAIIR